MARLALAWSILLILGMLVLAALTVAHSAGTIGARIAAWRIERGIAPSDAARMLGVTPRALSEWERSVRAPSRIAKRRIYCLTGIRDV